MTVTSALTRRFQQDTLLGVASIPLSPLLQESWVQGTAPVLSVMSKADRQTQESMQVCAEQHLHCTATLTAHQQCRSSPFVFMTPYPACTACNYTFWLLGTARFLSDPGPPQYQVDHHRWVDTATAANECMTVYLLHGMTAP